MDQSIIRRPSSIKPWGINPEDPKSGSVWVHMKAFKILNQFSKATGNDGGIDRVGTPEVQYAFLAPLQLQESFSHTWEAYESVASRLAQKVRDATKLTAESTALIGGFGEGLITKATEAFKNIKADPSQAIEEFAREAYNHIGPSKIPKIKIDAPLYYSDSARRTITLDFVIFEEGDPKSDIIEPVQDIMKKSCPDLLSNLNIDFPYMWELYTKPESFLNYKTCVLTAVQPTWNAPYVHGFPSSCNLSLTFEDLGPLYRSSITQGTSIRVISSNDSNAKKAAGAEPITTWRIESPNAKNNR